MDLGQVDFSQINFLTFALVFLAGVLTSFTPCIYPILPVTIGYIGARSMNSQGRAFILSLFYVLGLAMVYSFLGIFAALTGRLFGSLTTNPWILIFISNLYILLALWMFGVFNFQIDLKIGKHVSTPESSKGYWGSFWVGAASAFAAGPCTAPVLGGLLVWIGSEQNVLLGAFLMFLFSLGLGTLLIVAGTFAGILSRLPKSGPWLNRIKVLFGLVLLGASEYFLILAGKLLF